MGEKEGRRERRKRENGVESKYGTKGRKKRENRGRGESKRKRKRRKGW